MKIQVRYFASVREQLGAGEQITLAPGGDASVPRTVGELRVWLMAASDRHAAALDAALALRMAFNQELCGPDQPLAEGAEVAFFPPVTGG